MNVHATGSESSDQVDDPCPDCPQGISSMTMHLEGYQSCPNCGVLYAGMVPLWKMDRFLRLEDVLNSHRHLKWKVHPSPDGTGQTAYAIVSGNKDTKECWIMAVIEKCAAPKHQHNPGGIYGEMILTIAGELHDIRDDGVPVISAKQSLCHLTYFSCGIESLW